MKEKLSQLWLLVKTEKKYRLGAVLAILLLVGLGWVLLTVTSPKQEAVPQPVTSEPEQRVSFPKTPAQPQAPPEVFFEEYDNQAGLPTVPETINTYSFKTNYTLEEALAFGRRLGLTQYKESTGPYVVIYELDNPEKRGLLVFNQETGGFNFQSFGETRGPTASTNPQAVAATFLASLGVSDETVSCNITYQRKELPEATFVECHRDWAKVGLPILNFVGVLNIPENKPLAEVVLGGVDENMPNDDSIINTSTGEDGKIRPNDFNTATVAVSSDGRILSIDSNLRQIAQTTINTSQELLTPQQALDQFINHQSQLSLTIPAGQGVVDWNKVYQQNKAYSKKAIITDYVLTYLEKPASVVQDKLVPHYLVYGIAPLTSGYNVRFVETVPALRSGLSFLAPVSGIVAGTSTLLAQEDKSLKLGTFTPAPTSAGPTPTQMFSSPSPTLALPSPTPLQTSPGTNECDPSSFSLIFELPGVGTVGMVGGVFFSITATDQDFDNINRAFFDLVGEQYAILMAVFLQANPSFIPNSPSYSSLTSLFDDLNKDTHTQPGRPIGKTAPITSSLWQSWWGTPLSKQEEALNQIVNKTVNQLIAVLNNNTLNQLADRQNLFPQQVMDIFFATYIFIIESYPERFKGCKYISGTSPSIYFYSEGELNITVSIKPSSSKITYVDPDWGKNNHWRLKLIPPSSLISEHGQRNKLYYEYLPIDFTPSNEGFGVKMTEWEMFVRKKLAPQLGLTSKETEDLMVDVRNALVDIENKDYQYFKISFVDRKELDEKLPISISPKPDTFHRVHLLLTPLESYQKINQPKLNQLPRKGFTVVEVGAVGGL